MPLLPPRAPFRRHRIVLFAAALAAALLAGPLLSGTAAVPDKISNAGSAHDQGGKHTTAAIVAPGAVTPPVSAAAAPATPTTPASPPATAAPAASSAPAGPALPAKSGAQARDALGPKAGPRTWAEQQSAMCAAAVHDAEGRYPLPGGLLGTIAKVESGRPITAMSDVRAWPWTIDADGRGYFFESKAAAVAWAKLALARGVNFMDVGCMQVDLQMHPGAFRSIEDAFDPATNVDYGARYLQRLHDGDANGNWYVAVGLYHSHTPLLAAAYRGRVAAVGAGIVTGFGAPEPLYMRALRQGTLRLALAGGGVMVLHINRQPSLRRHPRLSACQLVAFLGADLPRRVQAAQRGCRARST